MSHNDKIWVSDLNARPEIRAAFPRTKIHFYDTTLRDGEQTVGVVLSPEQKLEIARKLDELGVTRIEAGFPRVSVDDAEAIQLMQKANLKAELWGFSRAVKGDVDELVRLGLRASVIEAPTSDIKLKAYGMTREDVLRRVVDAMSIAKQNGITTAFFAVDGTRTELDFLKRIYLAALEAGATEIVVVDTIGACGPEAVEFLVREVCEWVGPTVPVHFHGHNDFGMATACAIAAVRAGATWIQGTINGMGERAGNADICEIALALRCLYDVPVALDLDESPRSLGSRVRGRRLHTRRLEAAGRRKSLHARKRRRSDPVPHPRSHRAILRRTGERPPTHSAGKKEWPRQHRSEMQRTRPNDSPRTASPNPGRSQKALHSQAWSADGRRVQRDRKKIRVKSAASV